MTPEIYRRIYQRCTRRIMAITGLGFMLFAAWILLQAFMGGN